MITGTITVNNLTSDQFATVIQANDKHPMLNFMPNQVAENRSGNPPHITYTNVVLNWNTPDTLKVVIELLQSFATP